MDFTAEQLSKNLAITPDGFLICYSVPFARTGRMPYVEGEIVAGDGEDPLKAGPDSIIWVTRPPEVVFDPIALASFEGKPITNEHPPVMLTPALAKKYQVGHCQNVRRGDGAFSDYMIADFFITDPTAIQAIKDRKREVSAGYDAVYKQIVPGTAQMASFRGNHIAIVRAGRCGSTCAINDTGDIVMSKPSIIDKIKAAFALGDAAALDTVLKDVNLEGTSALTPGGGVHVHIGAARDEGNGVVAPDDLAPAWFAKAMDAGMKPVRDSVEELTEKVNTMDKAMKTMDARIKDAEGDEDGEAMDEDGTEEDGKTVTKDSAETMVLFRQVMSDAEILAPGIKVPTMDAAATVKTTKTALCKLRRAAVATALQHATRGKEIAPLLAGRTFDSMPCRDVEVVFRAGAAVLRMANNRGMVTTDGRTIDRAGPVEPPSNAEMNAKATAFWANPANNGNLGGNGQH